MVVFRNILWTEKAMGQKNGHGSPEVTSSIPRCCKPFTPLIQIVRDLEGEADHHDVGILSPQEWAMEEGVVSQIGQALPPPNHNDHLHRSINCLSHCNHLSGINHHHQDTFVSTHLPALCIRSRFYEVDSLICCSSNILKDLPFVLTFCVSSSVCLYSLL